MKKNQRKKHITNMRNRVVEIKKIHDVKSRIYKTLLRLIFKDLNREIFCGPKSSICSPTVLAKLTYRFNLI